MPSPVDPDRLSHRWLGQGLETLNPAIRSVMDSAAARKPLSRDLNDEMANRASFGDRLADRVASFGGSWTFISAFGIFLAIWTALNLTLGRGAFDPYPFIFLNLMLSMLAAIQAPIIMMSQNRQAARDRLDASHDYQVNLKAEIEIMALLEKVDALTARQAEQTELIQKLLNEKGR